MPATTWDASSIASTKGRWNSPKDEALTQMNEVVAGRREEQSMDESFRLEKEINDLRTKIKADNIHAVNEHEYDYLLGTLYTDLISECEKLGDYIINVVEARLK